MCDLLAGILNTNSRFIYNALGDFTRKIISKIPAHILEQGQLNKVLLVNSGSEATDLAMRIARSVVTSRRRKVLEQQMAESGQDPSKISFELNRDTICLQGAYHGVTTASDEVSTTLNDNPRLVLLLDQHTTCSSCALTDRWRLAHLGSIWFQCQTCIVACIS
jgi:4-aminobutyrate aminotransferase-like enzyme